MAPQLIGERISYQPVANNIPRYKVRNKVLNWYFANYRANLLNTKTQMELKRASGLYFYIEQYRVVAFNWRCWNTLFKSVILWQVTALASDLSCWLKTFSIKINKQAVRKMVDNIGRFIAKAVKYVPKLNLLNMEEFHV